MADKFSMKRTMGLLLAVVLLTGCSSRVDPAYYKDMRALSGAFAESSDYELDLLGSVICDVAEESYDPADSEEARMAAFDEMADVVFLKTGKTERTDAVVDIDEAISELSVRMTERVIAGNAVGLTLIYVCPDWGA